MLMTDFPTRTHMCGELGASQIGETVTLSGWVAKKRNLGGRIFVDLRDRSGLTQLAFDAEQTPKPLYEQAEALKSEWCIAATGVVRSRPKDMVNRELKTGEIELDVSALKVLSESTLPPFHIEDGAEASEDLRLKWRYLDLRRPKMQRNLALRDSFVFALRTALHDLGFLEIETPILGKSTPEGARDFLVPSRLHEGEFYALPQSPQLFKELLMVSGCDRYYQIARCFRDEDLRADRQPEFTQVDLEMSYVSAEDVMTAVERVLRAAFAAVDVELPETIQRVSYWEAMDRFGSDKPDTRFGMELFDATDIVRNSTFNVFSSTVSAGGCVRGLVAPGAGVWGRSKIDKLAEVAKAHGAKGLVWFALTEDGSYQSPSAKFMEASECDAILARAQAGAKDLVLLVADTRYIADTALGALRLHLADALQIERTGHAFLWVVDFPMFEYSEELGRYTAQHHPFTLPKNWEAHEKDPLSVGSFTYDFVMDGCEAGGGGLRIHDPELQLEVLQALGFSEHEAQAQFGFLVEALSFGAPPMGGFALGLDRVCMLCAHAESIRDVMAFPKTTSGADLMMDAPAAVDAAQLNELGL